jgi:hypothetical protein
MKIPFTTEQFFGVFEKYNTAVFPMQAVLFLVGCTILFLIGTGLKNRNRLIGCLLGCVWIWTGVAYHLLLFTAINKAAYIFGGAFILQGVLFIVLACRDKLFFSFGRTVPQRIGFSLILFGLALYPVIGYMIERSVAHAITFGLPCPTTIFTFGLLGLCSGGVKKRYMAVPLVWSFIGLNAAISMGVYHDVVMPIAALYTVIVRAGSGRSRR